MHKGHVTGRRKFQPEKIKIEGVAIISKKYLKSHFRDPKNRFFQFRILRSVSICSLYLLQSVVWFDQISLHPTIHVKTRNFNKNKHYSSRLFVDQAAFQGEDLSRRGVEVSRKESKKYAMSWIGSKKYSVAYPNFGHPAQKIVNELSVFEWWFMIFWACCTKFVNTEWNGIMWWVPQR